MNLLEHLINWLTDSWVKIELEELLEGGVSLISDDQSNNMFGYLSGAVHDCECCQKCMYRAWPGPVQFLNMEASGQVNDQGQLPAWGRGRREGVKVRGGRVGWRGRGKQKHHAVPDEIRATLKDHVINHRLTMAEAGRQVQPNVPRSTVSCVRACVCVTYRPTVISYLNGMLWH